MTLEEHLKLLEEKEDYTKYDIPALKEALIAADLTGFKDPRFLNFMVVIQKKEWNPEISDIVAYFVELFISRGESVPCASNLGDCDETCPLHEAEKNGAI